MKLIYEVTVEITDDSYDGIEPYEIDIEQAVKRDCEVRLGTNVEVDVALEANE